MSPRRNPFELPEQVLPAIPAPPNIYESLRVAAPHKRNRRWEKEHQSQKAVYRGIDPKLSLKVKSIASDLLVPEGEVARALIEYALRGYEEGDLDLDPHPNPYRVRMTLFPTSSPERSYNRPVKKSKQKQSESLWRVITTWRSFSPQLKEKLAALASEDGLNVPVGELVTALLRFSLKAYEYGLLNLQPIQKATTLTLALDGTK